MTNTNLIAALLQERDGYIKRGLKERIEAVDERLASLGYVAKETATLDPGTERATPPKARKRKR